VSKPAPLKSRIVAALAASPRRRMLYPDLGDALWPADKFPRASRYSSNGGPPGWAMPLGRALRELASAGTLTDHTPAGKGRGGRMITLLKD